jgi:hypothetical protein
MTDYLGRLAARALGVGEVAQPRRSLFEPRRGAPEPFASVELEDAAPPRSEASTRPREATRLPQPEAPVAPEPAGRPPLPPTLRAPEGTVPGAPVPERAPAAAARRAQEEAVSPTVRRRTPARESVARPARPTPEPAPARRPTVRDALAPRAQAPPPARRAAPAVVAPTLAVRPPPPPLNVQVREPAPTVRVTIGRVDVRAVAPEPPARPKRKPKPAPRVSLDEYLGRARSGGA